MTRFDVFDNPDGPGALLNVQSDLLEDFNTRLVVPLMPRDQAPAPARYLNPIFQIDNSELVMVTQFMATVPAKILRRRIGSLRDNSDQITRAIDMLLQGF